MAKGSKHDDHTDELPTQIVRGRVGPDPSKVPYRVSLVEPKSEIVGQEPQGDDAPVTVPLTPEPRGTRPRNPPPREPDDYETAVAPAARGRARGPHHDERPQRPEPPIRHEAMEPTGVIGRKAEPPPPPPRHPEPPATHGEPHGAMMRAPEPAMKPAAMMDHGPAMAKGDAMMAPAAMAEPMTAPMEPVVGWLVVIDGPGRGRFLTVHKGLSTLGRAPSQRLRIDFGDNRIEPERHAILIYDEKQRRFVVNHDGKTELVRVNGDTLIAPRDLVDRDLITIGATTMAFVAFCGASFDWDATGAMA